MDRRSFLKSASMLPLARAAAGASAIVSASGLAFAASTSAATYRKLLVLIELKRDRTPRDVVAQALDYASWVEELQAEDIAAIYRRFFRIAHTLEKLAYPIGEPPFQYIITTTEAPPAALQEPQWLICDPLNASEPSRRLLKLNL